MASKLRFRVSHRTPGKPDAPAPTTDGTPKSRLERLRVVTKGDVERVTGPKRKRK